MNAGHLLSDSELEVMAGDSFVEGEALHAQSLTGRRRVTEVDMKDSRSAAVFRRRLVIRQRLRRLLEGGKWLDYQLCLRQNIEYPRDLRAHAIENLLDGGNDLFARAKAR